MGGELAIASQAKIGLALGGGIARGIAHIGVLRALAELEVRIDLVAGTSSGSIIGALFAAGYPPRGMEQVARSASWRDFGRLVVPRRSLMEADRLESSLSALLQDRSFSDLRIPFAAVCTDLLRAQKVALNRGMVSLAVRASCSLPGVFPPVAWGDQLLADGGTVENVPVETVREMGADFVIGVDLYSHIASVERVEGVLAVLVRSLEITQRYRCQAESQKADVCIEPPLAGESLWDLGRVDEFIRAGYEATMAQREALLTLEQKAGIQ